MVISAISCSMAFTAIAPVIIIVVSLNDLITSGWHGIVLQPRKTGARLIILLLLVTNLGRGHLISSLLLWLSEMIKWQMVHMTSMCDKLSTDMLTLNSQLIHFSPNMCIFAGSSLPAANFSVKIIIKTPSCCVISRKEHNGWHAYVPRIMEPFRFIIPLFSRLHAILPSFT